MWRLPDSPRWLISKSKVAQAKRVLQRVRIESDVSPEIAYIQKSMEKQGAGGMAGLLQPSLRMPLIVGAGLAVFQQITGINTVIYYAPTIFKFAGINAAGPAILAGAALAMVMWCFHVLAIFLLDRVGRRPLLLTGVAGQIVGLAILGAAFQFQQLASFKSYTAIGGLVIYVACFAFGLGPIFWLLISEIYPLKGSRRGDERRDGYQLGNEPGGSCDVPDPGRDSGARRNFLVIRRDSGRRLGLLLFPGAGNQREES
jgi:SP family galactose:H+ symporter-like MFS transporter